MPGAPLLARPSAESVLPTRGRRSGRSAPERHREARARRLRHLSCRGMHPESPSPARMPWGFVAALSFAQLVSWGIVFYAFALFLEPMARELGWSKPALTLAY